MRWIVTAVVVTVLGMGGVFFMYQQSTGVAQQDTNQSVERAPDAALGIPLRMGVVELNVAALEPSVRFYRDLVGLTVTEESAQKVSLSSAGEVVLILHHTPDLPPAPAGSAGLYHTAILFESRAALAQAVERVLQNAPELFEGTADHIVSEAFYFHDPAGNGVELYFDRDPSTWQWQDGSVVMGSTYIDPVEYIRTYGTASAPTNATIGHVHLRVGDIAQAQSFYVELLGFSPTAMMPTALFVSDGAYHHQLGMNVWESAGAGIRGETLGLRQFEIRVPSQEKLVALQERLTTESVSFEEHDNSLTLLDPWGTRLVITLQP